MRARSAFVGKIPLLRGQVAYGVGGRLASSLEIQLGEEVADVMLDCLRRNEEPGSNLSIGQTLSKQGKDF